MRKTTFISITKGSKIFWSSHWKCLFFLLINNSTDIVAKVKGTLRPSDFLIKIISTKYELSLFPYYGKSLSFSDLTVEKCTIEKHMNIIVPFR